MSQLTGGGESPAKKGHHCTIWVSAHHPSGAPERSLAAGDDDADRDQAPVSVRTRGSMQPAGEYRVQVRPPTCMLSMHLRKELTMRHVLHVLQALTLSVVIAAPLAAAKTKTPPVSLGTTLDNLQTAFAGETNAHARYVAFSEKAQAEGFGEVASLFRALAASEQIHASNHAVVIRALGGSPREAAENAAV